MSTKTKWFQHGALAFVHDCIMAFLSFGLSLSLRVGTVDALHLPHVMYGAGLFALVCAAVFAHMRLYRGIWHFASVEDLFAIVKAVSLAILIFAAGMFLAHRLEGLPRSVLIINWIVLIVLLGAPRFAYRMAKDRTLVAPKRDRHIVPLLMVGMDSNTDLFLRDIMRDKYSMYEVIAIIDLESNIHRRSLHGIPVYGRVSSIGAVVNKLKRKGKPPQRLVLTSIADAALLEQCIKVADEHGLSLGQLPRLQELGAAADTTSHVLKPIAVEDLLGRSQTVLDTSAMSAFVKNKTVLITGAGGSIGGELCRQLAGFAPAKLVLLDNSEYALYAIDQVLADTAPHIPRVPVLGDVKNPSQVERIFQEFAPVLIFHAAAVKHVPLSEQNPLQAIETNVFGTGCVLDAAIKHNAQAVVLISTDKAVNPTNIMGATKRLAEKLLIARQAKAGMTRLVAVRFGNVLGSTGSVVPKFHKQLASGSPLTVTHQDMTRYFMTLKEASQLVIRAASLKHPSPLYVLDMGTPMKIIDLARNMIRLSGQIPDKDVAISFTGLRPGEKLYEELFYPSEKPEKTEASGVLSGTACTLDADFEAALASLDAWCKQGAVDKASAQLKQLVPEYTPL